MPEEHRSAVDRLADLVFYGPLGLALDYRRVLPHLAKRGRRQIAFTRTIGRYTVHHGRDRLSGMLDGLLPGSGAAEAPPTPAGASGSEPAPDVPDRAPAPSPEPGEPPTPESPLPIPQYDSLSAIQVVPRLDGLDGAELEQIRAYEAATRARRTILAKIGQLQQ